MTNKEMTELLTLVELSFKDFKAETPVVKAWLWIFEKNSREDVNAALLSWIETSGSKFAPQPTEIKAEMGKLANTEELSPDEVWAALCRGASEAGYKARNEVINNIPPKYWIIADSYWGEICYYDASKLSYPRTQFIKACCEVSTKLKTREAQKAGNLTQSEYMKEMNDRSESTGSLEQIGKPTADRFYRQKGHS